VSIETFMFATLGVAWVLALAVAIGVLIWIGIAVRRLMRFLRTRYGFAPFAKSKQLREHSLTAGLKDLIAAGKAEDAVQAYQKFTGEDENQARIVINRLMAEPDAERQQSITGQK